MLCRHNSHGHYEDQCLGEESAIMSSAILAFAGRCMSQGLTIASWASHVATHLDKAIAVKYVCLCLTVNTLELHDRRIDSINGTHAQLSIPPSLALHTIARESTPNSLQRGIQEQHRLGKEGPLQYVRLHACKPHYSSLLLNTTLWFLLSLGRNMLRLRGTSCIVLYRCA